MGPQKQVWISQNNLNWDWLRFSWPPYSGELNQGCSLRSTFLLLIVVKKLKIDTFYKQKGWFFLFKYITVNVVILLIRLGNFLVPKQGKAQELTTG
jgi:uncharacterized metal-binding protein